jgi:hypothetical protein
MQTSKKSEGLIRCCLTRSKTIQRDQKVSLKKGVEQYFPGLLALVDCTEQQIPRPKNRKKRRLYYLGKRKKHTLTVKNLYCKSKGTDNLQNKTQAER